jgi:spermidine/putrescine transport system substrate-binding protein
VPNEKALEVLDQTLLTTYPTLAISSEVLFQQEQLRDLGDGQKEFTRVVTEILAAQ